LFDPQTGSLFYKDKEYDEQIAQLQGEISVLQDEIAGLKTTITLLQNRLSE
jgi:peptidoglycan hydrolase CwlO-like protein